jgi:hypothetical protein
MRLGNLNLSARNDFLEEKSEGTDTLSLTPSILAPSVKSENYQRRPQKPSRNIFTTYDV